MRYSSKRVVFGIAILATAGVGLAWFSPVQSGEAKGPSKEAVDHARDMVQLADNMHKAYVINITGTYVRAQEAVPAAQIARKVYKHMEDNKFFSGRLVDASGKPMLDANVAKTEFEKKAVAAIKGGKAYYEEIGVDAGKAVLRAGTIVPAVMKQCTVCHTGTKEGDLLGVLTYEVPIK